MAEKQSKPKAKVKPKKSVADKKEAKVDLSQQLEELNENLKQEKDKILGYLLSLKTSKNALLKNGSSFLKQRVRKSSALYYPY